MRNLSFAIVICALFILPMGKAHADGKRLVCDYTDGIFIYRDSYTIIKPDQAEYSSLVAHFGETDFQEICSSKNTKVSSQESQMIFEGEAECADGGKADLKQVLNLTTMEISGTWKPSRPCGWTE